MVMHARKLPRINDGYYDCSDYHDLKNGNGDRSTVRDRRLRDDPSLANDKRVSPTYKHKSISAERRNTDRDRYERYQSEHREESNRSSEKNSVNSNDRFSGSNHIADSKSMDARTDSSSNVSRLKEQTLKPEEAKRMNSVAVKPNSTTSAKDPRLEAQKTALRVCGDWSEHVSSSGKKYFYNCKTEVSQWVKPKEWKVEEGAKTGLSRTAFAVSSSSKGGEDVCRNGDSPNAHRPDKFKLSDNSRRSVENHRPRDEKSRDGYTRNNNGRDDQILTSKEVNNYQTLRANSNRCSSVTSTPSSILDAINDSPAASMLQDRPSSERLVTNGVNDGSGDDMDISPDASPRQQTHHGLSSHRPTTADRRNNMGSSIRASQPAASHPSNPDQSMIWGKALETLQTLQEVLERSRSVPSQPELNAARPSLDSPRSVTSQSSPRVMASSVQPVPAVADVVETAPSVSREKSPTSEMSLGQQSALSLATESTIGNAVTLPQSLINYYDASLLGHISGWPAEQVELRAHMAYRDGLVICGHHCGRVSTELKRDRSHVRIAEVQSTLIEHRILFLKQQIAELETNDRNYTSGKT